MNVSFAALLAESHILVAGATGNKKGQNLHWPRKELKKWYRRRKKKQDNKREKRNYNQ